MGISQCDRVVGILRDAGSLGCLSSTIMRELAPNSLEEFMGCLKYTSRISDARRKGWTLSGRRYASGLARRTDPSKKYDEL